MIYERGLMIIEELILKKLFNRLSWMKKEKYKWCKDYNIFFFLSSLLGFLSVIYAFIKDKFF